MKNEDIIKELQKILDVSNGDPDDVATLNLWEEIIKPQWSNLTPQMKKQWFDDLSELKKETGLGWIELQEVPGSDNFQQGYLNEWEIKNKK